VPRISSHQSGISSLELQEAIPESLLNKSVHLHWIDKAPSGDGQVLLLSSKTSDMSLIEGWNLEDPTYHTNSRLLALERILTDPANEDMLLSL
jgi:hypothetical protein